jgi:cold shock CspA family protein
MALTGKLRTWNDDRGYGFIVPTNGGRELFVHISAFPRDRSRPTVGELLTYELGQGKDGKPQATRVYRQALGEPSTPKRPHSHTKRSRRSPLSVLIGILLVIALGNYGYTKYQQKIDRLHVGESATSKEGEATFDPTPSQYHCDGRTHCTQMKSCSEAKYFLENCPGTQMDGNNDGTPCEQQWCTSPFAK